jgi:hypothetical protein
MARAIHEIAMYRISKVFETSCVAILKIAGQVTDSEAGSWSEFLKELKDETGHFIVLDFCDVSRVEGKAAEAVVQNLPRHILLLNCPVGIKNMADSAGLREQVLEPGYGQPRRSLGVRLRNESLTGGVV